jgi:hypothetical protein
MLISQGLAPLATSDRPRSGAREGLLVHHVSTAPRRRGLEFPREGEPASRSGSDGASPWRDEKLILTGLGAHPDSVARPSVPPAPKGPEQISPGQRPGGHRASPTTASPEGARQRDVPAGSPSWRPFRAGIGGRPRFPRALPGADLFGPFGAGFHPATSRVWPWDAVPEGWRPGATDAESSSEPMSPVQDQLFIGSASPSRIPIPISVERYSGLPVGCDPLRVENALVSPARLRGATPCGCVV